MFMVKSSPTALDFGYDFVLLGHFFGTHFRKYAHPLHVKEGIITEKVFPVFSESFFWTCFGLVMYIWELMGVTEKFAFQM